MSIISLAALTILDAGPIGQVRAAARAGWRSVGLRLQPLLETDTAIVGHPERERDLRQALSESDIRVLEIGVFPFKPEFQTRRVLATLDFSAQIGASFLVAPIEDRDEVRRADHFAEFAQAAAARGLRALVEFNPYSACRSLNEALSLLDKAGQAETGLCLDALHFFRSGGTIAELARAPRSRFTLLHLCDAAAAPSAMSEAQLRQESRTARRLPGEGVLPLKAFLAALPSSIPLSIEAPSPRLVGLSAEARAAIALAATKTFLASLSA